ncbi:cytochrome C [Gammaproteobacteria bacterium 45_16_T64]|nr:cytochrome C [Gammaproteobacteria bacterium 45_16_T64]
MKKLIVLLVAIGLPVSGYAGGGSNEHVVHAPINMDDKASLQKGAQIFVNNCLGCHSAQYMRYERVSDDLEIPADIMLDNLVFTTDKIGDVMISSIPKDLAKKWFGTAPPDLTLEARIRGADWLYSYLISFYEDESRPWGVNNHVFKDVGMPHVLQNMQDSMSEKDFNTNMADLTNYMVYMAEPIRAERERLGYWVIGFLIILLIPVYMLNREYWKDVH